MTKHRKFHVPIWDVYLHVVVDRDPLAARVKLNRIFGDWAPDDRFEALASWNGHHFGVFFAPKPPMAIVAHEVFHVTHRILERADANFDKDHHEPASYLHGWLMDLVWRATR